MHVIPASQEAEIIRIKDQDKPRQRIRESHISVTSMVVYVCGPSYMAGHR
jgi:hypothetical protein